LKKRRGNACFRLRTDDVSEAVDDDEEAAGGGGTGEEAAVVGGGGGGDGGKEEEDVAGGGVATFDVEDVSIFRRLIGLSSSFSLTSLSLVYIHKNMNKKKKEFIPDKTCCRTTVRHFYREF